LEKEMVAKGCKDDDDEEEEEVRIVMAMSKKNNSLRKQEGKEPKEAIEIN
jgi:hypothetical protein